MSTHDSLAQHLVALQPPGSGIPFVACEWAIASAERRLGRTLHLAHLDAFGSRLSAPLLLLASTRIARSFKWTRAHRTFVAAQLLSRLKDDAPGAWWPMAPSSLLCGWPRHTDPAPPTPRQEGGAAR